MLTLVLRIHGTIRSPEGPSLRFRGSWKETYVRIVAAEEAGETYQRCVCAARWGAGRRRDSGR